MNVWNYENKLFHDFDTWKSKEKHKLIFYLWSKNKFNIAVVQCFCWVGNGKSSK